MIKTHYKRQLKLFKLILVVLLTMPILNNIFSQAIDYLPSIPSQTFNNRNRTANLANIKELRQGLTKVEIPFEFKNNFLILDVLFNKSVPLKFILDTGAEHTILTRKIITDLLGVPYRKKFTVQGADLTQTLVAYLINDINLQVENVRASNHSLLVLEEDYFQFEDFTGMNIHGIVGADFFRGYVLKFDFQRNIVTLTAAHLFEHPTSDYIQLPLEINRGKPYITTTLRLRDALTTDVKLLLDTGASVSLLVNTDTDSLLQIPNDVIPANIGRGLGGYLEGYLGRVKQLELGEYELNEIVTNFQDLPDGVSPEDINNRNGIIGNEILRRFYVVMDYARGRLYLKPNRYYKKKFKFDKSGLQIFAVGDNLNTFQVQYVIANSPAADAGLQKGDKIISINRLNTGFLSLRNLVDKLKGKEGKKIRLKIKRDGKKMTKVFYLKKLI